MSAGNHRDFYGSGFYGRPFYGRPSSVLAHVIAHRGVRALGGLVLLCALACTEFKPRSDIETNTGALTGGQGQVQGSAQASTAAWACLDTPPSAPVTRPTVSYTVTIVDSVTNVPPPGLSVRACDDVDTTCARPVAPATGVSADGRVRLSLARGFDGYFDIRSDSTLATRLYPDGTLIDDQDGAILELIDPLSAMGLASAAGVELQPDTGLVLARGFDCQGTLGPGIDFESGSGGLAFSFIDGLPIQSNTTGPEGLILFANVPKGFTLLTGTLVGSQKPMGSSTAESVPGSVVYADVRPPP